MTTPKIDPTDLFRRAWGPLKSGDRADRTVGCRQTQPQNCARNFLGKVCAFVRDDGICLSPPTTWKKQYVVLSQQAKARQ